MEQKIRAYAKEHLEEAKALLEELGKIPAPSHKEDNGFSSMETTEYGLTAQKMSSARYQAGSRKK